MLVEDRDQPLGRPHAAIVRRTTNDDLVAIQVVAVELYA
jgi:hypothetical protein